MSDDYIKKLHPEHAECPFVAKTFCLSRTRAYKWVVGIFCGLLSVLLALVVYASGQAQQSNVHYMEMSNVVSEHKQAVVTKIQSVQSSLDTYKATKSATDQAVLDKIDEVKTELSSQRKEQRALLEKILELQIEVARKQSATPK